VYPIRMGSRRLEIPPAELIELLSRRLAARAPREADATGLRRAAVLLPLLFRDGVAHVLFTQRSEHVPTHKGQISFPGGALEAQDADASAAALRETEEEIGIRPDQVRILGRLDDYATSSSGFVITPFVSVIPAGAAHLTSDREVARVLEVPLAFLLDPANRQSDPRTRHGQYPWGDAVIWGATARILNDFIGILGSLDRHHEQPG